jgi:short-subunit dehydrogenase
MYTILGAGGGIGTALAYELLRNRKKVRLISRSQFSIPL